MFTTVTVNINFQTACHQDAGDLAEGFGVMTCTRAGEYTGGYLVLPQYRVAVDYGTTDVLFADVHLWHGNTAMKRVGNSLFNRITCVHYYRTKIANPAGFAKDINNYQKDKIKPGYYLI